MKKCYLVGLVMAISLMVLITVFAIAQPIPATNEKADVPVFIPTHAVEVADNVFSLGHGIDVDGRKVEGFLFVDKRENAKPSWAGSGKGRGESKCFAIFAKGARWKNTEPYVTSNETGNEINLSLTETSLNTWDSNVSFEIFGTGTNGTTDGADDKNPDNKNEVMFEGLGAGTTIAYTIVWGIFTGPPSGRELVEWDTVFNSNYTFGDAKVSPLTVMDYQNIATHEFGHSLGLTHPDDSCTEETMYRFATFNETKKRNLEAGDIAGVNELYT